MPETNRRPTLGFWPHTTDPEVASTRIRCLQVVQGLRDLGREASLYHPGLHAPKVLVLSKRYDPDTIRHGETLRANHGTKLVLDLCDNHFYYKNPEPRWVRRAEFLREAAQAADLVVTASPELAKFVRAEVGDAKDIRVIGDALDAPRPVVRPTLAQRWHIARLRLFLGMNQVEPGRRLLWFGNHGSGYADGGMQDLALIADALHRHHRANRLTLTIISNSRQAYRQHLQAWTLPTCYLPWSGSLFQQTLAAHAIAVIPVRINPFTACKTNNRLATAFCNGLAVAAGRIPSYEEFAELALIDDWDAGLSALMGDAKARSCRVEAAKRQLTKNYGLEAICRDWVTLCDELSTSNKPPGNVEHYIKPTLG